MRKMHLSVRTVLFISLTIPLYSLLAQNPGHSDKNNLKEKLFSEFQKMLTVNSATLSKPGKVIHYIWNGLNNSWAPADTNWYSYNHSGQILSHTKKTANTYNSQKYTYVYNANGDVLERISFIWHGPTSQFQALFRESYAYNTRGHLVENFFEKYDTLNNSWKLESKKRNLITYNSNNKVSSYTIQNWDSLISSWVNKQRKTNYIYNSAGNIQQFELQDYNPAAQLWENYSMEQYSYNAQNKPVECLIKTWTGSAYENSIKWANLSWRYFDGSTFEGLITTIPSLYPDSKNHISGYTLIGWNYPIPNQWTNEFRYTATFDLAGGSVQVTETFTNSAWKFDERISINLDGYGNSTGSKYEVWSSQQNNWTLQFEWKYNHTYSQHLINSVNQFCPSTTGCENYEKYVYENYQVYSGLDDLQPFGTLDLIYPNPSAGRIRVILPEDVVKQNIHFDLFDLQGNKVFTNVLSDQVNEIILEQNSGFYLYTLSCEGKVLRTGKLILEK